MKKNVKKTKDKLTCQSNDFAVRSFLCLALLFLCSSGNVSAATWDDSNFPMNNGFWPTLHHDMHNSDHMNASIGDFSGLLNFSEAAWVLKEEEHPAITMTVAATGNVSGRDFFVIATGKTNQPNLYAFDMSSGSELWHAASPIAQNAGPGACAMASMALLDENNRLFISDCQYLFCYDLTATPGSDGVLPYKWRKVLPGLRQYNESDKMWHPSTDPTQGLARAKPFLTMFFTRKVAGKFYVGGIATDGGIYVFDPANGNLFAQNWLDVTASAEAMDWTPDGPCSVSEYVANDNPMYYDNSEGAADGITPFGIWATGQQPETNDPDRDYFMDPCQLDGYFNANTAGGGGMVINTPAVAIDPQNPAVSRIYVNGSQSALLSAFDPTPTTEDAIVYRIDFDPVSSANNRLTVLNNRKIGSDRFAYGGRMIDGENSLSSPTLSHNEKWVITADNQGKLYNFSAESGDVIWSEDVGSVLGSPAVVQRTESDGLFYIYAFGDSLLWVIGCNPETGAIVKKKSLDFRQHIIRNYWRGDNPAYSHHFVNQNGNAYTRVAVGASITVATDDKMVLVYTVGWHDPDRPAAFLIPSHSVILILDRLSLLSDIPLARMVNGAAIDKNGTMEQATLIVPGSQGLRALIPYGSQSTSFARFMEVNNKMPEEMKAIYMKPYGGINIARPVFAETQALTPDLPSGQTTGTSIRWSVAARGISSADYRFSVTLNSEETQILQDYSPAPVFVWTPTKPGRYTVRASIRKNSQDTNVTNLDAQYDIISPVSQGKTVSVTQTNHPLVALFTHNNCPAGARMRVDFKPSGSASEWSHTGYVPCLSTSANGTSLYVAGMKSDVEYELRPVLVSQGVEMVGNSSETLVFRTQKTGVSFPKIQSLMSSTFNPYEQMIFMSGFPASPSNPLPIATNLTGDALWYYNHFEEDSVVATAPTSEGSFLLIVADNDIKGQRLREIDLAGNVIREVSIARVNEQLSSMGQDLAGAFDHEAVRFPNGHTLVQVSVERYLPGVQPDSDYVLGAMIVDLDENWQVAWTWNTFDHLDVKRAAVNGEVCISTDKFDFPGCPPLFKTAKATDWIHGNHVAPSPEDGHLIYSMRSQDWVIKIDYNNGKGNGNLIWKLGAGGDFSIADSSGKPLASDYWFSHQHGAVYVSNQHLVVFDNGNTRCEDAGSDCHSRGQMLLLDETGKTAMLQVNADAGVYSSALGNGQRLLDGTFNFTAGMLYEGAQPKGQVIGVKSTGEKTHLLQADMNLYRSYKMNNLYGVSWDGFSLCSTRLMSDLSLAVPVTDVFGTFIKIYLELDQTSKDLWFNLKDYSIVTSLSQFTGCDMSYFSLVGNVYKMTLPDIAVGLDHYKADLEFMIAGPDDFRFKVVSVEKK